MVFDAPINAGDASFERAVLEANLPVVAVFWSPETTPREQLNEVLGATAQRYAGEVVVVKLAMADAPEAARRYEVFQAPQFLFYRAGQLVARARGLPTAEQLAPWVEYLLERGPRPVTRPRPAAGRADGRADGQPVHVTDASFDQAVLQAGGPVVAEFWAPWCGACRMVEPAVNQLAAEFAGRVRVAKLTVDDNPRTSGRYGITGTPTFIFFKNGQEVDRVVGAAPIEMLRQKAAALL